MPRGVLKTVAANLAQVSPPLIEIIDPVEGARLTSDTVVFSYLVRTPAAGAVAKVTAHLNGQFLLSAAGPNDVVPQGMRVKVYRPLAGTQEAGEAELSSIAENENGASGEAKVRESWVGAAPALLRAKPRLVVLAIGVSESRTSTYLTSSVMGV